MAEKLNWWEILLIVIAIVIVLFCVIFFPIYYAPSNEHSNSDKPKSPSQLTTSFSLQAGIPQWTLNWSAPSNVGSGTNLSYEIWIIGTDSDNQTKTFNQSNISATSLIFPLSQLGYGNFSTNLIATTTAGSSPVLTTPINVSLISNLNFIPPMSSTNLASDIIYGCTFVGSKATVNNGTLIVSSDSAGKKPFVYLPSISSIANNTIQFQNYIFPQSNSVYIQPYYKMENGSNGYFIYNTKTKRFTYGAPASTNNWWSYNITNQFVSSPYSNASYGTVWTLVSSTSSMYEITLTDQTSDNSVTPVPIVFDSYNNTAYLQGNSSLVLGYNMSTNNLAFGLGGTKSFSVINVIYENIISLSQALAGQTAFVSGNANITVDSQNYVMSTPIVPVSNVLAPPTQPSQLSISWK